ncbi:MAG: UDP-3-O-(3-hydroxymyristoyl)glucosamine N-acyltransferase [Desulfobulbaceae bacterium]|nr:UDP-3-O-(3-hydroxymyristoyl)glucosamine N-acyltransferase [Desulfobulbaceae bacterium]
MRTLAELADLVHGELVGDPNVVINGFNDPGMAKKGEITFIARQKLLDKLEGSQASAVLIPEEVRGVTIPAIRVSNPYLASAIIHNVFFKRPLPEPGVHQAACIGDDCLIKPSASIAPFAVIGNRVSIGENVVIESGVVIGDDVLIGENAIIEANVVVRSQCKIGNRVILYSGVVIGSDGFGYATDPMGNHIKRPQVGNVVIEDDVAIGANSCVDRATFGTTLVKKGSKIDNLVQVGHNVEIGEGCLLVSQSGLAGSSKLGNHVVLAGKAGVGDHVVVGDRVMIAGKSGVNSNVKSDSKVAGFPAISYKEWLRAATAFSRLPQLIKDVRRLGSQMDDLFAVDKEKEERRKNER